MNNFPTINGSKKKRMKEIKNKKCECCGEELNMSFPRSRYCSRCSVVHRRIRLDYINIINRLKSDNKKLILKIKELRDEKQKRRLYTRMF